ncbi:hypothetical protein [Aureispira anguillae]|uniref:Uncharacterized protein n=1 Tax=Aureispira anguillae TaxID=2864201 RepID=A0A916DVL4_9BACT|nr:hypothetical protein [Aureispira anguillae]BDS14496.1 hypothetical protein AsAng_0052760 [Aureispira anguillae]
MNGKEDGEAVGALMILMFKENTNTGIGTGRQQLQILLTHFFITNFKTLIEKFLIKI